MKTDAILSCFNAAKVAIQSVAVSYAGEPPFHPAVTYPEYPFAGNIGASPNPAYVGVREALRLLGLGAQYFDSQHWNPLGALIRPGDTVLLKPNLIRESHGVRVEEWEQVVTHGSVVRAVLDYVFIALQGSGRIVIADGPQTDSDFDAICQRTGLREIVAFYKSCGCEIQLLDLRRDRWYQKGDVICKREPLPGDPAGYTTVELGGGSEFSTYRLSGRFYGADYDMTETATYHRLDRHAYVLCRSVMDADVVINLPKMKTHKKTGVTLSLKNLVGVNGYRNCLPHHTVGTVDEGGDEFPSTRAADKLQSRAIVAYKRLLVALGGNGGAWARAIKRFGKQTFGGTEEVVRSGNWYGNDTTWRMVLDLNKAFFYFDGAGQPRQKPMSYLTVIDGIVAGDGNGPICPDARQAGLILVGSNPLAVDTVSATLMGFDYRRIPLLAGGWQIENYPVAAFQPDALYTISNVAEWNGSLASLEHARHLGFQPHFGWKGQIERAEATTAGRREASS